MVGFPGETDEDFNELKDFVSEMRFERMGAFSYSEEEGTFAAENYEDNVPEEVKAKRLDELMSLQENISSEVNASKIGKTFKTIIDRREGDYFVGRTQYDSPEVDCEVLVPASGGNLSIGNFYDVRVTESDDYDLYGVVENNKHNS